MPSRGGQVFAPQVGRIARCGGGASGNQQQEGAKGLFPLFHRLSFFFGVVKRLGDREAVVPRADLEAGAALAAAGEADSVGAGGFAAAFRDGCRVGTGDAERGAAVGRDDDLPLEASLLLAPVADNPAAGRAERCLDTVESLDRAGLHQDVAEGCRSRSVADAGQTFVVPDYQVAQQHDVVTRVHGRIGRVAVPELPDRRRTLLDHVSPARVVAVGGQAEGDVGPAVAGQPPA